jgi:hypothetical protein
MSVLDQEELIVQIVMVKEKKNVMTVGEEEM